MKRLKEWSFDWWENIKKLFKFLGGEPSIELYPPTRLEKKSKRKKVLILLVFITVAFCCILFIIPEVRGWNDIYLESWFDTDKVSSAEHLSFIASFWGSVIGASIAVIATVFTTWAIIHGERKIDRHTERIAHLPIIEITLNKELTEGLKKSKNREQYIKKNGIETFWLFDENRVFAIRNVGEGIAIRIDTTWYFDSGARNYPTYETLPQKDVYFFTMEDEGGNSCFTPTFFDIFGNYYKQTICIDNDGKIVEYTVPELVIKTERFRYVQ